jgi:hypothetical protein
MQFFLYALLFAQNSILVKSGFTLIKVLPKPNSLPSSTYQAKKIICPLTLGIEKIHACPNHCILY